MECTGVQHDIWVCPKSRLWNGCNFVAIEEWGKWWWTVGWNRVFSDKHTMIQGARFARKRKYTETPCPRTCQRPVSRSDSSFFEVATAVRASLTMNPSPLRDARLASWAEWRGKGAEAIDGAARDLEMTPSLQGAKGGLSTWFAGCRFCCQKADAIWQLAEGETWARSWRSWDFSKLKTLPTSSIYPKLSQRLRGHDTTSFLWGRESSFQQQSCSMPPTACIEVRTSWQELGAWEAWKDSERPKIGVCWCQHRHLFLHLGGSSQRSRLRARLWGLWGRAVWVKERKGQICGVGWGSMLEDVGWMMASWGCRLISQTWQFLINFLVFWWQQLLAAEERNDFQATFGQLTGCTWSASLRIK